MLFHLQEELGDVWDTVFSGFGVSFGGPNHEKSSQNHDKVSPGTLLAPQAAPGTGNMKTGHSGTPPPGPIWSPKFVLFRSLGVYFPLIFGLAFGKAPGSIFHGFWTIFSWFRGSFFPMFWFCTDRWEMSFGYIINKV